MSTFIERLLQEETELNEKKAKLESFIGTENFKTIAKEQQALLKIQVNVMATYSEILNQRIIQISEQTNTQNLIASDDDARELLISAAEPLVEFMRKNSNPHAKVIVDQTGAELLHGELTTGAAYDYSTPEQSHETKITSHTGQSGQNYSFTTNS
jgi:hypothetical protein